LGKAAVLRSAIALPAARCDNGRLARAVHRRVYRNRISGRNRRLGLVHTRCGPSMRRARACGTGQKRIIIKPIRAFVAFKHLCLMCRRDTCPLGFFTAVSTYLLVARLPVMPDIAAH
jgi:hypothetical protein